MGKMAKIGQWEDNTLDLIVVIIYKALSDDPQTSVSSYRC